MKLRLCGYFPLRTSKERRLGKYAVKMAEALLRDFPRIKTVQLTFSKYRADYNYGFSWLVKGNRVEIYIPRNFKKPVHAKWLIRHDLRHAKQILEKRLNKDLAMVKFTNRKGLTRRFKLVAGPGWYGQYKCLETGRVYVDNEPWEVEVRKDDKYG